MSSNTSKNAAANLNAADSPLRYGIGSEVTLSLAPTAQVTRCGRPPGEPLDDPSAAMAAALVDPLDFPPLSQSVVPGDRVTIALDPGLPQAAGLVAGVVDTLLAAGVAPADITLLRSSAGLSADANDPRSGLNSAVAAAIELVTHDPERRGELSYLAAAADGKPIYLNRHIHEADLVLPLGCLRLDATPGNGGLHGGLYPTFSDAETLRHFRTARRRGATSKRHKAAPGRVRSDADEVAWLLGLSLTLQVVPAGGGDVLHILAGEVGAVLRRGRELCALAWQRTVPQRAELVVAAIDGPATQQTWDNVARALVAARSVVTDGGTIALCTDLAIEPGPALRRLAAARDSDAAERAVQKSHTPDTSAALELLHAQDNARVYLLSRLEAETVEQLGIAPIRDGAELARLSNHFDSCILLESAQYLVPTLQQEDA
ncbi:MAG: lactate racemase domain-containing protein [Planctomycetia bacterium]|nr:lactate racemase domain-containing protein [Planctomycetia bacterium]